MKKLLLLLLPIALVSCEHQYHVKAQVTFQNGQRDTIEYTYWATDSMPIRLDDGDVYVNHIGTLASGARSFKPLKY